MKKLINPYLVLALALLAYQLPVSVLWCALAAAGMGLALGLTCGSVYERGQRARLAGGRRWRTVRLPT